jgi:hypothetical protein
MIVLDLPMEANDANAKTVRDYLKALLEQLWHEEEGFSGKRPFGNSGWTWDVYRALVQGGAIDGKIDQYGDLLEFNQDKADKLIFEAIRSLH